MVPTTLFQRLRLTTRAAFRCWKGDCKAQRAIERRLKRVLVVALVDMCFAFQRWSTLARRKLLVGVGSFVATRTMLRRWRGTVTHRMRRRSSKDFQSLMQTSLNSQLLFRVACLAMALRSWRKCVRHMQPHLLGAHSSYTRRCRAAFALWLERADERERALHVLAVVRNAILTRRARGGFLRWARRAEDSKLDLALLYYGSSVSHAKTLRQWAAAARAAAASSARCERASALCVSRRRWTT